MAYGDVKGTAFSYREGRDPYDPAREAEYRAYIRAALILGYGPDLRNKNGDLEGNVEYWLTHARDEGDVSYWIERAAGSGAGPGDFATRGPYAGGYGSMEANGQGATSPPPSGGVPPQTPKTPTGPPTGPRPGAPGAPRPSVLAPPRRGTPIRRTPIDPDPPLPGRPNPHPTLPPPPSGPPDPSIPGTSNPSQVAAAAQTAANRQRLKSKARGRGWTILGGWGSRVRTAPATLLGGSSRPRTVLGGGGGY